MAQIAYLLLCHKHPERVIAQARQLIAAGDRVAIHFDARSPAADFEKIKSAMKDEPSAAIVTPRKRCGWGEWSLVDATLVSLRAALQAFPAATHFYLISGDCMPTKSASYIRRRIADLDRDWIDATPFETSSFIQTGFREERLIFRHFFNERTQRSLFYTSYHIQRVLGLKRRTPQGLQMMVGSQWWCLRRSTAEGLLNWLKRRPDVLRFFKTTWIPDESFFQTLVAHLVPPDQIESRTPTFVKFTDYGQPVTFYNDHLELLKSEDCLFARKIGVDAEALTTALGRHFVEGDPPCETAQGAGRLHDFLTKQGRVGERHGERIWEAQQRLPDHLRVVVIVCKKWHLSNRLSARLADFVAGLDLGHVFDEDSANLPDLGGHEQDRTRRNDHKVAFLNAVLAARDASTLVFGCDPSRRDVIEALVSASARPVSVVDLKCPLEDTFLYGHARRIGLLSAATPDVAQQEIIPALRRQVARERQQIAAIPEVRLVELGPDSTEAENRRAFSDALGLETDTASLPCRAEDLFQD